MIINPGVNIINLIINNISRFAWVRQNFRNFALQNVSYYNEASTRSTKKRSVEYQSGGAVMGLKPWLALLGMLNNVAMQIDNNPLSCLLIDLGITILIL